MSKIKLTIPVLALVLLSICTKGWAQESQNRNFSLDPMYRKVFDQDSLKGFDEQAARAGALSEGFFGSEFTVRLYNYKREYINNKYGLRKQAAPNLTIDQYLAATRPAAIPGCVNEDFEASTPAVITSSTQILGWTVTGGYLATPTGTISQYYPNWSGGTINSCNLITCCPMPPSVSEIIDCSAPGGFVDPDVGGQYPIYSVFGAGPANTAAAAANPQITSAMTGNKVIRLNDGVSNFSIQRLSKTFSVTGQNSLFQFAFISVFATQHSCCDASAFSIKLTNATTNSVITCPNFSVSAPGSLCLGGPGTPFYYVNGTNTTYTYNATSANATTIYNKWQINSMDLTAYIGQNITIDIIVSDCDGGAHYGKIFFDAQCGPMTIYGNGTAYDAGSNITVPTCGAAGATICAADGLGPYSWGGPGLPTNYTIPSFTNQCLVTSVSAQYTLYMQPAGSCAPIARIVNSTVTPAPLLVASALQATCGSTLATISVTPSGSAANPSSLTWSPTPLSLNSPTTQGTYVIPSGNSPILVSIVASDPLGCKVTATANVNPAPPIPTFTIVNSTNSNSITCDYPAVNLNATTTYSYNGGSLKYFWSSASTTFSAPSVSIVNAGTYTVIGTDSITNCSVVHLITIGVNTLAPTSNLSPMLQSITCGTLGNSAQNVSVTASPSVNITHQILSPYGGTFAVTSYSTLYTPGGVGTFTYCLKNDINGCSTCKEFTVTSNQGFPNFSLSSPENFTLGCTSRSCAVVHIDNGNTTPQGGAVSYTLLSPGSSTALPSGTLSAVSVYTTCSPGTYTVVTKDAVSQCETRVPITILQNTFTPHIDALYERQVLDCNFPKVTLKGLSYTPNVYFGWVFSGTPNSLQGDTITALINSSTTSTVVNTYTLVVTDSSSTCKSETVIPIYQNLFRPKASISAGATALSCLTNSAVLTNLSSSSIPTITGFPTNLPTVGFLWEGPTPQSPQSNSTTYLALTVGVYTMTAKDLNNGCTAVTTLTISDNRIYPDLDQSIATGTLDCGAAQTTIGVTLTNPITTLTYAWTSPPGAVINGSNAQTLSTKDIGEYSVLVTNTVNGCARSADFTVVNGSLTADFEPDQITGFAPLTVNFTNNSTSTTGNTNINSIWSFGNGSTKEVKSVGPTSNLFTLPGTYTITLYATKGTCLATKQRVIKLDIPSAMEIPNVFTPNNDGTNDLFFIKATNLTDITAVIFDRWGHKVYEVTSTTGNVEWDGKNLQGKDAAEGTYFYTIKATGKEGTPYDRKGTINLYR